MVVGRQSSVVREAKAAPGVAKAAFSFCRLSTDDRRPNGQGQNRTADTVIFSHVLYQLSYLAGAGENIDGGAERRKVLSSKDF
jgi:hypothetical protein